MKRTTIVGLCLAATFAAGAVGAASASAASPEYKECGKAAKNGKLYTGKYSNKTCSEVNAKSEGKYELVKPKKFPAKLKGTVGSVNIWLYEPSTHTIKGHFQCTGGKDEGTISSSTEGTLKITYTDCEATGQLKGPCNSTKAAPGVVVSEPLATKLEWLNSEENEPGVAITSAKAGAYITDVECDDGLEISELYGTMLAKVEPTTATSKVQTLTLSASETTGEPEFFGYYEGGTFQATKLYSALTGLLKYPEVPLGQASVFTQKGPDILVTG